MYNAVEVLDNIRVLGEVRQRYGSSGPNDDSRDELIEKASEYELFDSYMQWEGIIGYSSKIWNVVTTLYSLKTGTVEV